MAKVRGQVVGNIDALVEEKLGFVKEWVGSEPEIFVHKEKGGDLTRVSTNIKLTHKTINVESGLHRSVAKSIDELVDKVKPLLSKEKARLRDKRLKECHACKLAEEAKLMEEQEAAFEEE